MTAAVVTVGRSTGALVEAARPRQWLKNLLVFAGILFAGKLGDTERWLDALLVFASFSLMSSAAYLINDVRDAEADRQHPLKRHRPIARGALPAPLALVAAATLAATGISLASRLGSDSLAYAFGFVVAQLAYSFVVKRIPFVDVLMISGLFVLRAAAGADGVDVAISPWLLLCTALLALFLAVAKRRGELVLANAGVTPGRRALGGYSVALADRLLVATAVVTVASYLAYAVEYAPHTRWMALTTPFVAYGVWRYLEIVRGDDLGEEPERVLLSDRRLLAAIAGWAVAAIVVVTLR